jgi:hypothetical protein
LLNQGKRSFREWTVAAQVTTLDRSWEAAASTAIAHPRVIGKVKSISSDDMRTILELERDAILKEFHSLPTSVTVEVVNHNYVSISFTVRGQQCGDAVYRIRGKWERPDLPRATVEA